MVCHARRAPLETPDTRCHSTQGQRVQQEGPDISRLDLLLQAQWDHAANAHLGSIDIKQHSRRKVWWKCDQCPDGHPHSWEACISDRTRGNGCPQYSGRKVCQHNSLATKAPLVAAQWDYEVNDGTPDSVVAQSNQPADWLCDACGHRWSVAPNSRVSNRSGCPKCAEGAKTQRTRQALQTPKTLEQKLAWQNGTLNAMHLRGTFPKTPG